MSEVRRRARPVIRRAGYRETTTFAALDGVEDMYRLDRNSADLHGDGSREVAGLAVALVLCGFRVEFHSLEWWLDHEPDEGAAPSETGEG